RRREDGRSQEESAHDVPRASYGHRAEPLGDLNESRPRARALSIALTPTHSGGGRALGAPCRRQGSKIVRCPCVAKGPGAVQMIAIRVVSRAGEVLAAPLAATFGDAGGDIGRGADCTLVLPDPERRISRRHAHVSCRGVNAPAEPSAQQTLLIGALLRAMLAGTLELLAARSIAKRELGASPTLLRTRENNPLKFSPDADAALAHMLGPPQRGFVPPLEAVADAFGDLRAHELALLAGMRAALEAVVARLDPQVLQERLAPQGLLGSMVPLQRKARLWEAYGEQHAQIVQEIEGDIDSLFARAFRQAYEAQLARLQGQGR